MLPEMNFIKTNAKFDREFSPRDPAPLLRKKFVFRGTGRAFLYVCGLGYGYYYMNGKPVAPDLLTAPVSDYDKILWYNKYDVTALLCEGENIFCAVLGNGFFNESFQTPWRHYLAGWRDRPKLAAALYADGQKVWETDESFLCTDESFVTFNQLRSGETYDGRLYDPRWLRADYDDSAWHPAVKDERPPKGTFRECKCPPVTEAAEYDFVAVTEREGKYTLDFGQNLSGYVRLDIGLPEGRMLTLRHAEEMYPDGRLKLNKLEVLYPSVDFQTDRFIAGGERLRRAPQFTYHGFRYVEVEGLDRPPEKGEFKAVFIHQNVQRKTFFSCSDQLLNKIYEAGIKSVYSNMHYALTDCPTREKLGWMNDAQASFAQIFLNFDALSFFEKWGEDIKASMTETGEIPAIVPTADGYGFRQGPVADGALFELPYQAYLYTGSAAMLLDFLPYMERYYSFYTCGADDGEYWLGDWDGFNNPNYCRGFVREFYLVKFCRILRLACGLAGKDGEKYRKDEEEAVRRIRSTYIDSSGRCVYDSQTVVSMLLCGGMYEKAQPLAGQLCSLLEKNDFHIGCGMLGAQYLFDALAMHGAAEYAYKAITARGIPGFAHWFDEGATTLWETWRDEFTCSRNHHMFSGVLAWFFHALLGIRPQESAPGFRRLELCPCFIAALGECRGGVVTPQGEIRAQWKREKNRLTYTVFLPEGVEAYYRGKRLRAGINVFTEEEKIEQVL